MKMIVTYQATDEEDEKEEEKTLKFKFFLQIYIDLHVERWDESRGFSQLIESTIALTDK